MCLDILWTDEQTAKWLENKPDTIAVYKVVMYASIYPGKVIPPCYGRNGAYKKTNKLSEKEQDDIGIICTNNDWHKYGPFFHLFRTKEAAEDWVKGTSEEYRILKCEIPKKAITAIGRQYGYITIVTKEFTFVEGDEYFKEEA